MINKRRFYPWLVVAMLCVVGCLNYLDRMMITTMRTSIMDEIPMSEAHFGLLTSVFLWIYGMASPFAGYLADKFNRSKVIIGSLFIWSLVTWLTSTASNFEELLLARAFMGVSEACYIPAALALIVDYHPGNTKSTATGLHIGGVYVGQSLGFIGGWIAESHSWHYAFHIFGIIGVVYALILVFLLKDKTVETLGSANETTRHPSVNLRDAFTSLFSNRAFNKVLLIWGLAGAVSWMVNGWLPTYYLERFHLSQTQAGVYSTIYFFTAMLLGVILGGAMADLWAKRNTNARILLPAIGFLVAVPGVILASYTDLIWVTVMGFVLYAFTRPFIDANMMPILERMIDKRFLATGYGILNFCSCLVGGIGIYAAGVLRDAEISLSAIFQVAAITMIICAITLFSLVPKSTNKIERYEKKQSA